MKHRSFSFFLGISIVLHILSVIVFAFPGLKGIFSSKRIIISSVKVNMVGMPQKQEVSTTLTEKKTLQKKTISPVVKSKPKKAKPKKRVKKKADPNKNRKKVSQKKESTKKEKSLKDKASLQKKETEDPNKQGNKLSEGEGDKGKEENERNMEQLRSYITDIIAQIRFNWNLPKHLTDKDFYAQVEVKLNERGEFLEKRLFTSSQNELFDRLVLEAVEKSSPFPPPPDSIKSLIKDGIVFGLDSRN